MKFELLVAIRYLRAKRKQAVISLITVISIIGVAAGVAALIIALAINAGFREDLQKKLLGAQAHVSILAEGSQRRHRRLHAGRQSKSSRFPASCSRRRRSIRRCCFPATTQARALFMKGIIPEMESRLSALSHNIVARKPEGFHEDSIIIGKELAKTLGVLQGRSAESRQPRDAAHSAGRGAAKPDVLQSDRRSSIPVFTTTTAAGSYVPLQTAQRLIGR